MTAELLLTESQKLEIGKVIKRLNANGSFITASVYGEILRISGTKKEIEQVTADIQKFS